MAKMPNRWFHFHNKGGAGGDPSYNNNGYISYKYNEKHIFCWHKYNKQVAPAPSWDSRVKITELVLCDEDKVRLNNRLQCVYSARTVQAASAAPSRLCTQCPNRWKASDSRLSIVPRGALPSGESLTCLCDAAKPPPAFCQATGAHVALTKSHISMFRLNLDIFFSCKWEQIFTS